MDRASCHVVRSPQTNSSLRNGPGTTGIVLLSESIVTMLSESIVTMV